MSNAATRVVVKFKVTPDLDGDGLRRICDLITERTNARLVRPPSRTGRALFQIDDASDLTSVLEQVRTLPSVEYVEPDIIDHSSRW
jgi:hypothetical protein